MSVNANLTKTYADLGDAWLRHQIARLHQKHLQFGRHVRLNVDALLDRAARTARSCRPIDMSAARENASADDVRRTRIERVDRYAPFHAQPHADVLEATTS